MTKTLKFTLINVPFYYVLYFYFYLCNYYYIIIKRGDFIL